MRHLGLLVLLGATVPVPARALEAPVSAVTVFSDRARVTRTANVTLDGRQRIELPLLGDRVDASTIRLDSADAEVQTVDLKWVTDDEAFPRDEARQVLDALAVLDAEIAQVSRDRKIHELYEVPSGPALPSLDAPRPSPKLESGGWGAVMAFSKGWAERSQKQGRALDERLSELGIKRAELAERARKLGGARRGAWRVTATVAGKGRAALQLSYLVAGARWYPSYDIQLDPAAGKVQVAFAGLVSQETGEDWERAAVTLSTAIPATTAAFPRVYTWKIGEKERFIPKPSPYVEPLPPVPPAIPRKIMGETVAQLRQQLLARAALRQKETGEGREKDELRAAVQAANEATTGVATIGVARGVGYGGAGEAAKADKNITVERDGDGIPDSPEPAPAARPTVDGASVNTRYAQSEELAGAPESSISYARGKARRSWQDASTAPPIATIGIAPPPGYQPAPIPADLPASLAGGYDLTYKAAAAETIRSGKGARRVALFGRAFPVSVERRVFPDLAPEAAFLVAEVKNPTGQPLPGGQAKLFVGADPAGVAQLKTVAAGETFTLPLGLDRAIKPIRNVRVVTSESGFISKDETSEYTVTIEVANPGRQPLRLRIVDQVPVTDDKDVEVKLVRTSPGLSAQDPVKGKLEWQLGVPASGKGTVSFVYTLKRPKGYRLHQ